ncbi:MAG: hypothetical protein B6D41_15430 [Chloroflexi bacterium UTCFX4]|jgi:hypothetical protein|nr:MAG: hypothetical protein B6D41_15430 [Chloroflexi bacterium UTCFX4]
MNVILDLLGQSGISPTQAFMWALFLPFLIPFFYLLYRAPRSTSRPRLRSIPAYDALKKLMSRAAETGQQVHVSVGVAGIAGAKTADTMAGLYTLEFLADRAANSDIPPLITVTDPTALPAASDQLRRAYDRQGYPDEFQLTYTRFVAPPVNGSAVPYAAGVMDILQHEPIAANVMVGAFGDEFLLMAEPGAQRQLRQIGGTSDPNILPLAQLTATEPLLGEEIFAAGAYLLNRAGHYTSLIAQDIFRIALALLILLVVLLRTLGLF